MSKTEYGYIYRIIKSIFQIGIKLILILFVILISWIILVVSRCTIITNDFTISQNGVVNAMSAPLKNIEIREFEPTWDSYKIVIKDGYDPKITIDINNISDRYEIIYQRVSYKDSIISNSDFHLCANKRYEIENRTIPMGPIAYYIFTTDSLCRIDSIFHNNILIYPK